MYQSLNKFKNNIALIGEDGIKLTYKELDERVTHFCKRFKYGRGLVLLNVRNSVNTIIAYIAALRSGCPVYINDTDAPEQTNRLLKHFSFLYLYDSDTDNLTENRANRNIPLHPDLAVLLSTSGSTGATKSVRLSFENITANADSIAQYLDLTENDCAPTNLPFQYCYGLSVINSHLTVGATIMLTERSVIDPIFWELFDKYNCTSFAGVPHTYDLLDKSSFNTADHPTLRYATQAGGKLPKETVKKLALCSAKEGWRFFVMYGQTEAAPRMAYLPPELAATNPQSIGIAIPDGSFTLEGEDGSVITKNNIVGELVYSGPNVMMGYALNDKDLLQGSGLSLLRTGDLASRNETGLYHITGRKNRFVKTFGLRISLDSIESHLTSQGIEAICCQGKGEHICIVTPQDDTELISQETADWIGIPVSAINVITVDTIPHNTSGKPDLIKIKSLITSATPKKDWGDRLFEQASKVLLHFKVSHKRHSTEKNILKLYQQHFRSNEITPDQSFVDLGGDSLSYVALAIDLKEIIGYLPDNWENLSLLQLELIENTRHNQSSVETETFLRALAIFLIVANHRDLINYPGGAAYSLLIIAGFNFSAFQVNRFVTTGSIFGIFSLAMRVALPTMAYVLFCSLLANSFDYRSLLLIANLFPPHIKFTFWFIDVYVQILISIMALALVPGIRTVLHKNRFWSCLLFSIASILLYTLSHELMSTAHLHRRLPYQLLWLFSLGMTAKFATRTSEKSLTLSLFLIAEFIFSGPHAFIQLTTLTMPLLIWCPNISVPKSWVRPISWLAGASLFIYLTHAHFAKTVAFILGAHIPLIEVMAALLGGVLTWNLYNKMLSLFSSINTKQPNKIAVRKDL